MTIPALLIGTVTAALLGALYHFIRGGNLGRLVLYLFAAVFAFWLGHTIADILTFHFLSIGPIRAGAAVFTTILGLVVTEFLSEVEPEEGY